MDNQPIKQTKQGKSANFPLVTLSDLMKSGTANIDRVEAGKVYYNVKVRLLGSEAMFQFPVEMNTMDEKFAFLSIEKTKVFRDHMRVALERNQIIQIY